MNLFELFVKIGVNDEASEKLADIGGKLGNGLKTAAKIGTSAVGMASTAIVGLTKQAVESYAEYEQLVGGAELMFGKAYDTVAKNAQNAYKTVQMSQNEYLQQVNGFATGLKTALGGNEQAAADLSHKIIQAEADIIAATGNSAENVQNAFNGIMKSNFTMLDNLQIGITPTKEGFQEVINKVNDWNKANGKATKYQMGNLADMQSALVDYIDMVGMSGYAQNEASKTIQGSLASTKAAWSNLLTGIASDDADFEQLINNLVDAIAPANGEGGLLKNILPRVQTALEGAGTLIEQLFPVILDIIPDVVNDTLPTLLQSGVNIIKQLLQGITDNPDLVVDTIMLVIETLTDAIIDLLPDIIVTGALLLGKLAVGLIQAIPDLVAKIPEIITEIVDGFTEKSSEFSGIGKDIVLGIWEGLKKNWTTVTTWFSDAWDKLIGKSEDKLEIGSPSKRFKRYGKWTAEGYGIGFENEFADVSSDIEDSFADLGADTDYGIATATSTISSYSGADRNSYATQNVNVTVGIDDSANAMGLARALLPFLKIAEKEVYA